MHGLFARPERQAKRNGDANGNGDDNGDNFMNGDVAVEAVVAGQQVWALEVVALWRLRGRVPHSVESTAQLVEVSYGVRIGRSRVV